MRINFLTETPHSPVVKEVDVMEGNMTFTNSTKDDAKTKIIDGV